MKWAATSFLVWGSVCGSGMLHPWLALLLRSKLRVPKLSGQEDGGISTCTEIFGEPPLLAVQDSEVRPGRRSQLEKLSNGERLRTTCEGIVRSHDPQLGWLCCLSWLFRWIMLACSGKVNGIQLLPAQFSLIFYE